jgi:intracellular multiplication protein IcmG
MSNVHSFNQDDVLSGGPKGGDDELSPNEFGDEVHDDDTPKKGKSNLVMYGGITVAVLVVLFFVWKVFISPHLQRAQQDSEAFQPLAPSTTQLLDPAAAPTPAGAPNQQPNGIQPAAAPEVTAQQAAAVTPAAAATQQAPAAGQPVAPVSTPTAAAMQAPAAPPAPATNAAPTAQPSVQSPREAADGLVQVNARIDNLERSLAAIQEMVNKMTAASTANAAAKPAATPASHSSSAAASATPKASRQSVKSAVEKATSPKKAASTTEAPVVRAEAREEKTATRQEGGARATLKAVLDGRAWFQTKSGETITVAVGDEVPGLGVVKSIDTDRGEVRFANGVSVQ